MRGEAEESPYLPVYHWRVTRVENSSRGPLGQGGGRTSEPENATKCVSGPRTGG